jgi:hypothetical protein
LTIDLKWTFPAKPRLGVLRSLGLGAAAGVVASLASPVLLLLALLENGAWQHMSLDGIWIVSSLVFVVISAPATALFGSIFAPICDALLPKWKYAWILAVFVGAAIGQLLVDDGNSVRQLESPTSDFTTLAKYYGGVAGAFFGYARFKVLGQHRFAELEQRKEVE